VRSGAKLGGDVAVRVLPGAFAHGADRMVGFEGQAQADRRNERGPKSGAARSSRSGAIEGRPSAEYSLPNWGDISLST
jgi:hypothetical protein